MPRRKIVLMPSFYASHGSIAVEKSLSFGNFRFLVEKLRFHFFFF